MDPRPPPHPSRWRSCPHPRPSECPPHTPREPAQSYSHRVSQLGVRTSRLTQHAAGGCRHNMVPAWQSAWRDGAVCMHAVQLACYACSQRVLHVMRRPPVPCVHPVSYTHLTLPTICSV
eukprot:1522926-Prymnesium_polylepis.2